MTFKVIPGWPYEVNELGEVRNINTQLTLKPRKAGYKSMYRYVMLQEHGLKRQVAVHTLVAEVFIGPRPIGHEVRHLDGDPTNNSLTNLAYGTSADNSADCIAHGTTNRGTRMWKAKLDERRVRIIRGLHKLSYPYKRIAEICSVTPKHISDVIRRRSWDWVV
jgi:hypothetical protein